MKKILLLILVAAVVFTPAVVFSQESESPLEIFINSDEMLSGYIDQYAELIENRDETIEKFENMRLSRKNTFFLAISEANRDKNIVQVDYTIENTFDSIKSREAWLEIEFRKSFLNLYLMKKAADDAKITYNEALAEYNMALSSNSIGYISENELLSEEYKALSSRNSYLIKQRNYEAGLRSFNMTLGFSLDNSDYEFDFNEDILIHPELNVCIDNALANSSSLKALSQQLEKYSIEKKYFDKYALSTNLTYVSEALRLLEINTRLTDLQYAGQKASVIENITTEYNSLIIERERLALTEYNIKILTHEYEINKDLYYRGYIDKVELSESLNAMNTAKNNYITSVYGYNTLVKTLNYNCADYSGGSDSE